MQTLRLIVYCTQILLHKIVSLSPKPVLLTLTFNWLNSLFLNPRLTLFRWRFYTPNVTVLIPVGFRIQQEEMALKNEFSVCLLKLDTGVSDGPQDSIDRLQGVKVVVESGR